MSAPVRKAYGLIYSGIELALFVGLGTWAGQWLDNRLGTEPWLLLLGAAVGFGIGLWRLVRKALSQGADCEERKEKEGGD